MCVGVSHGLRAHLCCPQLTLSSTALLGELAVFPPSASTCIYLFLYLFCYYSFMCWQQLLAVSLPDGCRLRLSSRRHKNGPCSFVSAGGRQRGQCCFYVGEIHLCRRRPPPSPPPPTHPPQHTHTHKHRQALGVSAHTVYLPSNSTNSCEPLSVSQTHSIIHSACLIRG